MKRATAIFVVLVVAIAAAAMADRAPAGGDDARADWSPIVYPLQRLPLIFSHRAHLARGTACVACHPTAPASQSAVDNLIPTEAQCRACHAIERSEPAKVATPVAACTGCHLGFSPDRPVERVYRTPSPLKFSHAAHAKTACETCHADIRTVDLATTAQLPTMASCLGCHSDGDQERHCADCHLAKAGGAIETRFDQGQLVPAADGLGDTHGPLFARDHKQQARQVGATCTACHERSECVECHDGVAKPVDFHPGNYLLTHAVDARRGTPDCSACHRTESFCVGCHEREGLGSARSGGQFNDRDPVQRFHPIGWSSPTAAGPNLHAHEARRNITTCTSCHREEECTTCHSAQSGAGHISPHPPGWRSSAKCRAMDRGNRRMCLRCHVTRDELGCDWSK